jgi:hypothetical protein
MVSSQAVRYFNITPPAAIVDNADYTTNVIDTVANGVKFDYLTIVVQLGATDIAMTALKMQQSDASASGFADITGTVGGTDFTLPSATDDNGFVVFNIDLRGKKRYFDLVATAGNGTTGTFMSAMAILSRAKVGPNSATDSNALAVVTV